MTQQQRKAPMALNLVDFMNKIIEKCVTYLIKKRILLVFSFENICIQSISILLENAHVLKKNPEQSSKIPKVS